MNRTCEERGSFMKNRNDKETDEIRKRHLMYLGNCDTESRCRESNTQKAYLRQEK